MKIILAGYPVAYDLPPPCNPNNDDTCLARNTALGKELFETFDTISPYFHSSTCPLSIQYSEEENLKLTINKRFDNPSLMSKFYILYGKVEADILASDGQGIISSIYLQSDDLDEIDIAEIFGGRPQEFQSNYFVKGNTTTYDRGGYHPMNTPPMSEYHRYGVEWTPNEIVWKLDGETVRVLTSDSPQGFPTSPMFLKFSLWAGGDPDNEIGTIGWAGGESDYDNVPYSMFVKKVHIIDYSTGSEYCYGHSAKLGQWIDLRARQGIIGAKISNVEHDSQSQDIDWKKLDQNEAVIDDDDEYDIEYVYEYIEEPPKKKKKTKGGKKQVMSNDKRFIQYANGTVKSTNSSHTRYWSKSVTVLLVFQFIMALTF